MSPGEKFRTAEARELVWGVCKNQWPRGLSELRTEQLLLPFQCRSGLQSPSVSNQVRCTGSSCSSSPGEQAMVFPPVLPTLSCSDGFITPHQMFANCMYLKCHHVSGLSSVIIQHNSPGLGSRVTTFLFFFTCSMGRVDKISLCSEENALSCTFLVWWMVKWDLNALGNS